MKLRTIILAFISLFLFIACQEEKRSLESVLEASYEQHFISSGDNFPQISLKTNDRYKFLIGLHNGFQAYDIGTALHWSDSLYKAEVELLKDNGYLKGFKYDLIPAINIIMQDEATLLFKQTEQVAQEISNAVIHALPKVKAMYQDMHIATEFSFEVMRFFLLSDVLLDNWQINNVEREFLEKGRPLRHGKRYYIQYAEIDSTNTREVFGIYGNQYTCKNGTCFITYGNNRKRDFKSFEEMQQLKLPVLNKEDQAVLSAMAEYFKPALIDILLKNRSFFMANYEDSNFTNENSFEEYFIWYYHFLYTKVTNNLATQGYLQVPESGNFRVKLSTN